MLYDVKHIESNQSNVMLVLYISAQTRHDFFVGNAQRALYSCILLSFQLFQPNDESEAKTEYTKVCFGSMWLSMFALIS